MTDCENQLKRMGIAADAVHEIRTKDGISVYRITAGGCSYVLKYFSSVPDRREIQNYQILHRLDIPTIPLIAVTDRALLMEDLAQSPRLRLGTPEDLNSPRVAASLAGWYRSLHQKGADFVQSGKAALYEETSQLTRENLSLIAAQTQTRELPVWKLLKESFDLIREALAQTGKTLTYNDFYYTNLVVSKDGRTAFPFDYNLMGKGYAYADIRNVTCSLGQEAKSAFLEAYGGYNEKEALLDEIVSPLVTLLTACRRAQFPNWAKESLERLQNGRLESDIKKLAEIPPAQLVEKGTAYQQIVQTMGQGSATLVGFQRAKPLVARRNE